MVRARQTDLMHAGLDNPSREPFKLLSGLQKQAAIGNANWYPPAISQPNEEARKPRLAVDGLHGYAALTVSKRAGLAFEVQ